MLASLSNATQPFAAGATGVQINPVKLRSLLMRHIVTDDLRVVCFDLDVAFETVVSPSDKLQTALINVIHHFQKTNELFAFVARLKQSFPKAAWAEIYEESLHYGADFYHAIASTTETITFSRREAGALRVFLCHADEDKSTVRQLYRKIKADGMQPWLDEEDLSAGKRWKAEIRHALESSDVIIVCLSHKSVQKNGFIKKEIQYALDLAEKQPDKLKIIPVRTEPCDVPEQLSEYHWINLYDDKRGVSKLMDALQEISVDLDAKETQLEGLVWVHTATEPQPKTVQHVFASRVSLLARGWRVLAAALVLAFLVLAFSLAAQNIKYSEPTVANTKPTVRVTLLPQP